MAAMPNVAVALMTNSYPADRDLSTIKEAVYAAVESRYLP